MRSNVVFLLSHHEIKMDNYNFIQNIAVFIIKCFICAHHYTFKNFMCPHNL